MVSSVSFGNEQQQQRRTSAFPAAVVGTGAGALVGGMVVKEPMSAQKALEADKFELSQKVKTPLTTEEAQANERIQKARANYKNTEAAGATKLRIDAQADEIFDKEATEMTNEEFLAKVGSGEKEGLKKLVENSKDGKLTKEAFKINLLEMEGKGVLEAVEADLKTLGKRAPRVNSGKVALIGAGVGLVAGVIAHAIFGRKSQA